MEHEPIKYADEDAEDGEISDSDDGYTPLQRPGQLTINQNQNQTQAASSASSITKMEETSELDESLPEPSTDSDSGSESGFNTKSKMAKLRIKPRNAMQTGIEEKRIKYNIWSSGLQEESLMENLKGCGVDRNKSNYDRSIESYDYTLGYRLNEAQNSLKRRQSTNSDDSSNNEKNFTCFGGQAAGGHANKRFRANSMGNTKRKNVRMRLGHRSDDSSSNDGVSKLNSPRCILDLNIMPDSNNDDIARDMANKLYEEKDELMLRIINILGTALPIRIFKETQQIESNGGMLVMNGIRRRTPGGVFLFLLKNSEEMTHEQKKQIFADESKKQNKEQKLLQAMKRDRKVEELKKSLKIENDLTVLSTRSDLAVAQHLKAETHANLSNPPPSPVTDCNRENSSDFDTHNIPHVVNVTSPEKAPPFTHKVDTNHHNHQVELHPEQQSQQQHHNSYEDDFLDMHCDDMDLF